MADTMETGNRERRLRVLAVLSMALLGGYQAAVATQFYTQLRWPENEAAPGFSVVPPWPSVSRASERAKQAGLKNGDRLLAVQGYPYVGDAARFEALEKAFPGDRIRVHVESPNGVPREVSWQLEFAHPETSSPGRVVFMVLMTVAMPFLCLLVGFWTVLARPGDRQAWLLLGMVTTFSHSVVHPGFLPVSWGLLRPLFHELHAVANACWPLFMFLFAWEFPRRTEWQDRRTWLRTLAILLFAFCILTLAATSAATSWGDPQKWGIWIDRLTSLSGIVQLLQMGGISCFFALLTYKRFALKDIDSVRRMRTILFGATLALTPLFLVVIMSLILRRDMGSLSGWVIIPALLAMCLFPVTLAYAIVVHRAFGLSMVIRQGLQYALASRGIRILQVMLIVAVILTAVIMATQPGMNRPRILQVAAIGTFVVLALQRAAEWLTKWVDRRFFREAYNAEVVLANLSDDVRTMVETKLLLEKVATRISEALHVDRIALLLREGGQFQPAYAMGFDHGTSAPLPESARTAEVLRRDRAPLRVYMDDSNSWIYREGLSGEETAWLWATGAELLLPLAVKDKLLGFVSMGRKRSEEPYTGNDLKLLQSVAVQTGLALENSQLAAAIAEAVAQRERLNREVEIAQEVQERLFPQNLPEIAGLDYWGYCRPARGVGGDSYDFLPLESGLFAISIGDVSGKGVPASLLMASMQSALRGQAMSMPADLGAMIGTLNRLIFDSSPSNRYATLFYCQFDPANRVLTYVNGGHCPPMIVRGDTVLRLEDGGPVVGLFRPARFTQGRMAIERGDVLVGFTDGVSEAMNALDEEWGEDALGRFLLANRDAAARELIPKIVAAADAFADGTPQHDDMTLIVVRFL
ncbi:MAG: SpoIIE family protein phosphatase [Acidobacteria bacterium]|nr:SpoIIE family protein phosphatase [Acidobacteriota bacterium]